MEWPAPLHPGIVPVFLPFMGCEARCVFCAQDRQTGRERPHGMAQLCAILDETETALRKYKRRWDKAAELAFYGGTFTALPEYAWKICIDFVERCRRMALIGSFRCSTRPDALEPTRIQDMKSLGCGMIELGIQSFDNMSLALSRRGYEARQAMDACDYVKRSGLKLGVQLLPGMPGNTPEGFVRDVRRAVDLQADMLRFYPCLVISGTELEKIWRKGLYEPWSLEETMKALTAGLIVARKERIPVSRIALAQDDKLRECIMAGPWHPSLGSRISGLCLYKMIKEKIEQTLTKGKIKTIFIPAHVQGFFWGFRAELKKKWEKLGITGNNVKIWEENWISLECNETE